MPKSKDTNTKSSTNKSQSELPGLTTLVTNPIDGTTRYRKFDEFNNHWKEAAPLELSDIKLEGVTKGLKVANKRRLELKKYLAIERARIVSFIKELAFLKQEKQAWVTRVTKDHETTKNQLTGQIIAQNERMADLEATAGILQEAGRTCFTNLLEYGDHTIDCNVIDLRAAGRILGGDESEYCTCGWITLKKQLSSAKERGETGQVTEQDIRMVIDAYKAQ